MVFRGDTYRHLDEGSIVGDAWYARERQNEGILIFFLWG